MKRFRDFITVLALLTGSVCVNGAELGVQSTSTVLTAWSGGTATGSLMLVNCGTNNLTFNLTAHSSQLEYIPQNGASGSLTNISTNNNAVELVFTNRPDEVSGSIALPFGFPFYKNIYTNVFIGENGGIALGAADAIGPDCAAFPTTNAPTLFIAPYWGALEYRAGQSRIYYLSESNRFIVLYDQMDNDNYPGAWQTFEVILGDRGQISFRYDEASGFNSVVRGVQDRNSGCELNLWTNQSTTTIQLNPDFYTVITNSTYGWVSGGTAIALHDPNLDSQYFSLTNSGNSSVLPIGFQFPFYGGVYTNFKVTVNGVIALGCTNEIYGSINIPSSIKPYPLIVPFGEERLIMTNNSSILYKSITDGLVITYNNMWVYPPSGLTGGLQTFQVILNKSGDITFQYNTLNGSLGRNPLITPVVGMQDYAAGLYDQVAPTAAFVLTNTMDNYAIKFSANKREWLSVSPSQGTIPANRFTNVTVKGSSAGLTAGQTYAGEVLVTHNASNYSSPWRQPVTLHVLQSPGPFLSAGSIRYEALNCYREDRIGPGDTVKLYVTLENSGSSNAAGVTAELKSATYFSVSSNTQSYGEIPAYEAAVNVQPYVLSVSNNCPAGLYNLSLVTYANPSKVWSNTVQILVQPTPVVTLPSEPLMVLTNKGKTATASLVISNSGNGPLVFSIDDSFVPTNYVWRANTNSSVVYGWESIEYSGGSVAFHDPMPDSPHINAENAGYSDPINIGFQFPFWGKDYEKVVVHANGVLTLPPLTNALWRLNWGTDQGPLIAAYWPPFGHGGLCIDSNAVVRYKAYTDRLVISYLNVSETSDDATDQNFQIVLRKDGTIKYQYKKITGWRWYSSKIGVESDGGLYNTASLVRPGDTTSVTSQYGYVSTSYSTNIGNRVIQFEPGVVDWISSFSPASGTLQPHQSLTLNITCTAADLSAGTYQADMLLTFQEGLVRIPVAFLVTE